MALSLLPDELILSIISLLEPEQIVPLKFVSKHFQRLARDSNLWKEICFDHSRFEASRRRREWLAAQEEQLVQLRRAFQDVSDAGQLARTDQAESDHAGEPAILVEPSLASSQSNRRHRALVNWDPTYPGEHVDFYEEYVQRHGVPIVDWFEESKERRHDVPAEAMGVGTIVDSQGVVQHTVAPMDNGSLCIWNASPDMTPGSQGRITAKSAQGFLSIQPDASGQVSSITNETGAIENVSVDSKQQKGYFAVHDTVSEVDLNTLQIISRKQFAFPVSCVSVAEPLVPMTVGTTNTMHLFDPRGSNNGLLAANTEQIGGTNTSLHSSLSEPGPLSILHHPLPSAANEIWVGGRFKSLLCYDRRFWPRVSQTMFSGARISSLSVLPYPFLSRAMDLTQNPSLSIIDRLDARAAPGSTLLAAGEYRGKGSLELYNLAPSPPDPTTSSPTSARYQNRQTASRTRLLSIAPHGSRVVFADGDGNLKWTERDGTTLVREFNINDHIPKHRDAANTGRGAEIRTVYHDRTDSGIGTPASVSSDEGVAEGVFAEGETGDIVQRVLPTRSPQNDLLIWTADGRLGTVGFGRGRGRGFGSGQGKDGRGGDEDEEGDENERREQLFGMRMRRALERQADEARFVRGLGVG